MTIELLNRRLKTIADNQEANDSSFVEKPYGGAEDLCKVKLDLAFRLLTSR